MNNSRKGALGALMDEYERASNELLNVLGGIDTARYEQVTNEQAPEHTRSIQAIMRHVNRAAYGYANYIRRTWDLPVASPDVGLEPRDTAMATLRKALAYTEETLEGRWSYDEELDTIKMKSNWEVEYSLEQMLEHAIVHILRHRRQIEKILTS